MSRLRRLSALLFGLLFLQLMLLGNGGPCRSHQPSRTHVDMAGMHAASAPNDGAPSSHDGCGAERIASTCASMPSCAAAVGVPVDVVTVVAVAPSAGALPEPVSIHSQPAVGPDVPPPRG